MANKARRLIELQRNVEGNHILRERNELSHSIVVSANSMWNIVHFRAGLLKAIPKLGFEVAIVAPDDGSICLPAKSTMRIYPVPIDRSGLNPVTDLRLIARYYALFKRMAPAAYLSFTIKPNIYGALAARLAGVPSIANVSGLGTAFIRGGAFASFITVLYRLAFAKSQVVFFQNGDDRELFLRRRIVSRLQARLLPGSGVDLERFTPAAPLSGGPPIFLYIGRILADKGVREFAEAAALIKEQSGGARFQLLGSFDTGNPTAIPEPELRAWVSKGIVEYLGAADDVRPFIAKASAIVLPSYREGLPRSLLEGGAMARPLIASDVPGCREIVQDGVTGLLCDARSSSSLAAAMARFAKMGVDQQQMLGDAARSKVKAEYDERLVIDAYMEILKPLRGIEKA